MTTSPGQFEEWLRSGPAGGAPAIPASTVILLRDHQGALETLMMRKASKLAFGGMWVFPGGRIDDGDVDPAVPDDPLAAARRAAVREAAEEADLVVDPELMVPFAFWLPPKETPKRFATWFFVAPAPNGEVTVDGGEIHDHRWIHPGEMLRLRDAGEVELAPPTWVSLRRLAGSRSVAEAMAEARTAPLERFETRIGVSDGELVALWHGDAGYEAGDAARSGPRHRLVMARAGWSYERSG